MRNEATRETIRIVQISDLHLVDPWTPLSTFDRIIAASNALEPDLVVLTGDFGGYHGVYTKRVSMDDVGHRAARLRARIGVFAILGNHDWTDDLPALAMKTPPAAQRGLEAAGVRVLRNDRVRLSANGIPFWLAGIDSQLVLSQFSGNISPDLDRTLAPAMDDDHPLILLAHEPDIFACAHPRPALTISGHMHGGQVSIAGWRPGPLPSAFGDRYIYGHVREHGRDLIVSGGIGYSRVPIRLGCPPEVVLIEATL